MFWLRPTEPSLFHTQIDFQEIDFQHTIDCKICPTNKRNYASHTYYCMWVCEFLKSVPGSWSGQEGIYRTSIFSGCWSATTEQHRTDHMGVVVCKPNKKILSLPLILFHCCSRNCTLHTAAVWCCWRTTVCKPCRSEAQSFFTGYLWTLHLTTCVNLGPVTPSVWHVTVLPKHQVGVGTHTDRSHSAAAVERTI